MTRRRYKKRNYPKTKTRKGGGKIKKKKSLRKSSGCRKGECSIIV